MATMRPLVARLLASSVGTRCCAACKLLFGQRERSIWVNALLRVRAQ